VLRAEALTARYAGQPTAALLDVDLELQAGERLLLLGPNGAGKSTFIRVFAGLMHVTRGRALIDGLATSAARHLVGVVSHATYLYDELTALENLRLYAELYCVAEPVRRASALLERVGLLDLAGRRVGSLSRGQQQRVTIARALLHDPPLLLLDEPETGLDVAAWDILAGLLTDQPRTVVLTTHQLAAGLALGTRAAVLSRGQLVHSQATVGPADAPALAALLQRLAAA
jgi:ABC-type multidrug transport system ATPase subunit